MPTKIEATELQLKDIFSDDYDFRMPIYQRPYAWTREETQELINDLINAMNVVELEPYFLGSIVITRESEKSEAYVVDGQQRLTTITILFCTLRDLAKREGYHDNASELDQYIKAKGNSIEKTQDRFRLSLRDRDNDFFQKNIQEFGALDDNISMDSKKISDSQLNLGNNANLALEKLSDLDHENRIKLSSFLALNCYLVVVSASNEEAANRIFMVMNDRGLNLSATDILKSYIIGKISNQSIMEDQVNHWEEIEVDLGREHFRDLFSHVYTVKVQDRPRQILENVYRRDIIDTIVNADNFINDILVPYSEAYRKIRNPIYYQLDSQHGDKIKDILDYLQRIDNEDWIPPVLECFKTYQDEEAILRFLLDFERLVYGVFILRYYRDARVARYGRILSHMESGLDLYDSSSPLQLTVHEKSDILTKLDEDVYRQGSFPKTLLLRLDSMMSDEGARYNLQVTTVEHVLPQNPQKESEWIKSFPDPDVREDWTHRLGNLVLLSRRKNSKASNWDFERKKQEYFQRSGVSTFALTTDVLKEKEWTLDVLKRRQSDLINIFKKGWRLD